MFNGTPRSELIIGLDADEMKRRASISLDVLERLARNPELFDRLEGGEPLVSAIRDPPDLAGENAIQTEDDGWDDTQTGVDDDSSVVLPLQDSDGAYSA